jgi:predicted GH43/DUF377 family glycosyl hydrolase
VASLCLFTAEIAVTHLERGDTLNCAMVLIVLAPFLAWTLGPFVRPLSGNPVIAPRTGSTFSDPITRRRVEWEANDTFNPGAVVRGNDVVMLYRAEDASGVGIGERTSRLGFAFSKDGIHFKRKPEPVFFPAEDDQVANEWPGGCEDPRLAVTEDGTYALFYTQWNRKNARLAIATSPDLEHWTKHGPIFQKDGIDLGFYKSGSPLTKIVDNRLVMAKVKGKYWLYWGEDAVHAATSENLVDWTPLRNPDGSLTELMKPRPGFFDSLLTECGPPALMTSQGVVLIYNGKNADSLSGDPTVPPDAYSPGQALFDLNDPRKLVSRLDHPFLVPTESFEKSGQYRAGTVFAEGLVEFHHRFFLYFGAADSRVGVAIWNPTKNQRKSL